MRRRMWVGALALLTACGEVDEPAPDGGAGGVGGHWDGGGAGGEGGTGGGTGGTGPSTGGTGGGGDGGTGGPYADPADPCPSSPIDDRSGATGGGAGTLKGRAKPWIGARTDRAHGWPTLERLERAAAGVLEVEQTRRIAIAGRRAPAQPAPSLRPQPLAPEQESLLGEAMLAIRGQEVAEIEALVADLHERPGLDAYRFAIEAWASPELLSVRFTDAATGRRPDREETQEVIARLGALPEVESATPHPTIRLQGAPDDPLYPLQWHLHMLDMEAAWAVAGEDLEPVVVAVVDSGVAPHEDLWERLLPGYDMVSEGGRGPDPAPTPAKQPLSTIWHGQLVAGIIGATTNNATGLAGISPNARIVPVKVTDGAIGKASDFIAGLRWAVGIDVPGVPKNPNPAKVVNVSMAEPWGFLENFQRDLDEIVATGAAIVVAAGNDSADVADYYPSGYAGMITVAAADGWGRLASYSNFGDEIAVLAPGGDGFADRDGDGHPDHVVGTVFEDRVGSSAYGGSNGTSFAAPIVTGVAALLKGVDPSLSPAQIRQILVESAHPFGKCGKGCGAGMVNPLGALHLAGAGGDVPDPGLLLANPWVHLGEGTSGRILLTNRSGEDLPWSLVVEGEEGGRLQLAETSGVLGPWEMVALELTLDRSDLPEASHVVELVFLADGKERRGGVSFVAGAAADEPDEIVVGAFRYEGCNLIVGGTTTTSADEGWAYELEVPPGDWFVLGVADADGDGEIGPGDAIGTYEFFDVPGVRGVGAGASVQVDFSVHPVD